MVAQNIENKSLRWCVSKKCHLNVWSTFLGLTQSEVNGGC